MSMFGNLGMRDQIKWDDLKKNGSQIISLIPTITANGTRPTKISVLKLTSGCASVFNDAIKTKCGQNDVALLMVKGSFTVGAPSGFGATVWSDDTAQEKRNSSKKYAELVFWSSKSVQQDAVKSVGIPDDLFERVDWWLVGIDPVKA